jgi:hypothetical protein
VYRGYYGPGGQQRGHRCDGSGVTPSGLRYDGPPMC